MHILITGAAGFVGQALAKRLLCQDQVPNRLILTDIVEPPVPPNVKHLDVVITKKADLCSESAAVVDPSLDAVFIFHGVMSSGAEADFDLGFRANFDATRALLDQLRHKCPGVRVVYASSGAVYGGELGSKEPLDESVLATPESSYGMEKLMCECMINEYTRRRFIDGLVLRFPTVTVRPGRPTQAASSFYSGLIREPMNGEECVIPTTNRRFRHWVCSPRILVENLVLCLRLEFNKLPSYYRVINHPGIGVTIQDMIDALEKVGGKDKLRLLKEKDDPEITKILYSWAADYNNAKPLELGFKRDTTFEQIVLDYKESLGAQQTP